MKSSEQKGVMATPLEVSEDIFLLYWNENQIFWKGSYMKTSAFGEKRFIYLLVFDVQNQTQDFSVPNSE